MINSTGRRFPFFQPKLTTSAAKINAADRKNAACTDKCAATPAIAGPTACPMEV